MSIHDNSPVSFAYNNNNNVAALPSLPPSYASIHFKATATRLAIAIILALALIGGGVAIGLLCSPPVLGISVGISMGFIGLAGLIIYATHTINNL